MLLWLVQKIAFIIIVALHLCVCLPLSWVLLCLFYSLHFPTHLPAHTHSSNSKTKQICLRWPAEWPAALWIWRGTIQLDQHAPQDQHGLFHVFHHTLITTGSKLQENLKKGYRGIQQDKQNVLRASNVPPTPARAPFSFFSFFKQTSVLTWAALGGQYQKHNFRTNVKRKSTQDFFAFYHKTDIKLAVGALNLSALLTHLDTEFDVNCPGKIFLNTEVLKFSETVICCSVKKTQKHLQESTNIHKYCDYSF